MGIAHFLNCPCFCNKPGFALTKTNVPMKPHKPLLHCPRLAAASIATCLQLETRKGITTITLCKKHTYNCLSYVVLISSNNLECLSIPPLDKI